MAALPSSPLAQLTTNPSTPASIKCLLSITLQHYGRLVVVFLYQSMHFMQRRCQDFTLNILQARPQATTKPHWQRASDSSAIRSVSFSPPSKILLRDTYRKHKRGKPPESNLLLALPEIRKRFPGRFCFWLQPRLGNAPRTSTSEQTESERPTPCDQIDGMITIILQSQSHIATAGFSVMINPAPAKDVCVMLCMHYVFSITQANTHDTTERRELENATEHTCRTPNNNKRHIDHSNSC